MSSINGMLDTAIMIVLVFISISIYHISVAYTIEIFHLFVFAKIHMY